MNSMGSPVKQAKRIVLLDSFRGLAIFGILMVNLPLMYQPVTSCLLGSQADGSVIYNLSRWFISFFFEGKFYVIFSMLFGYGFWLFMKKKRNDNRSMLPVYRRRIIFLFLFGVFHIAFLWAGDILVVYALFGFALLLFRRVSDKGLIRWAIGIGAVPAALAVLSALMVGLVSIDPTIYAEMKAGFAESVAHMRGFNQRAVEIYSTGTFYDIMLMRFAEYRELLPGFLYFYPVVLSMFLVGVWSARKGIISDYSQHIPFFRRVFWWSLSIGLVASMLYAFSYGHAVPIIAGVWEAINAVTHTLGGVFLGIGYLSGIVLLYAKGKAGLFMRFFAPVGRMALTNYLMHSMIAVILFHPYGLGFFGQIELWQGILLAFLIFGLQVVLSIFWLRRFRFGPFEWVWRSLTYLKPQPFKIESAIKY